MKFLIVSHAFHFQDDHQLKAYAPYVREINLWIKRVNKVNIIAPKMAKYDENISLAYKHKNTNYIETPSFSLIGLKEKIYALLNIPSILKVLFHNMKSTDHIHLRCPGNMGLLGCLIQILFPSTPKTAKYAGNWDPKAKQPWSYNLQKWILSNTMITRNMTVLVYGNWPDQSKNIKPFFTASYYQSEIKPLYVRNYTKPLHFCFVGSLVEGKQPELALKFIEQLRQSGREVILHFYGDGILKDKLQKSITNKKAEDWAFIYGNQPKEQIKKALQYSHFLILPSQSEGWPKAVAEAMFWGCIPIASQVSCIPWMLGQGERGILMRDKFDASILEFQKILDKPSQLEQMSKRATEWSRQYTLDDFEKAICKLLPQ